MKRVPWTLRLLGIVGLLATLLLGSTGSSRAQGDSRTFPETGKTVGGTFLQYWNTHGGLAQQGYPISDEMQEKSDLNGQTYTVQYFERAVFEKHPENQPPYDVLLSQLGTFRYKAKYGDAGAPGQQPSADNPRFFPETKHTVGGKFRAYWEQHGGLAQQGYPISDEFTEVSDLNGQPYTVQYFERAVFELHPENQPPFDVLLSQLGTFQQRCKYQGGACAGGAGPAPTPAPAATSTPAPSGGPDCSGIPDSQNMTVTPNCGPGGTVFSLTATGFTPGETVSRYYTSPTGDVIAGNAPAPANGSGVVTGYTFRTDSTAQTGIWAATYEGQKSHKKAIGYFKVTPPGPPPPAGSCDVPASKDATVTPGCGTTSDTFEITINGFATNEGISFWVTAPNGSVAGTAAPLQVGSHGSTLRDSFRGSDFVQLASLVHSPVAGVWAVTYQGASSQHQSIVYIKIQQ